MNWIFISAEYITTAIEILIYFGVIGNIAGKRFSKYGHLFLSVIFVIGITCITKALNNLVLYSYMTAAIWMVVVASAAACLYKYSYFSSFCLAVIYGVLINVLDLIVLSIIEILFGYAGFTLEVMTSVGAYRCFFILFSKCILVFAYILFSRKRKDNIFINRKTGIIIIASSTFCFFCMQELLEAVIIGNVADMRRGILVAWLFIVLFIISIIFLVRAHFNISKERTASKVIETRLETLEQDNKNLNIAYNDISKITHDFKNHLRTISTLAQNEKQDELLNYLNEVASDVEKIQFVSYTGVDSIDAVINNKKTIAEKDSILFVVDALPLNYLQIRSTDLCAILVNLLDNAIEACKELNYSEERQILLSLSSINSMLVIKCINTYQANATQRSENGDFITTKEEKNHGYGLQIIKAVAEKYNGSCAIRCEDKHFIAAVMLSNNS